MSVKILLERKFKEAPKVEQIEAINELRLRAMQRKRYISGETLVDLKDNRRIVVISVWANIEEWEDWFNSEERRKLEAKLDKYLEESLTVKSFMFGADYLGDVFTEVLHDSETAT
ncbi:MAG: antibiotic biosynthesis monooxygenase [Gammaproteobacteria bacterium]|jgi:heme-degrading monooxygenase HmoA|nr:antibiotic biosynthesis monooxygenase [Gammaproteobacteria bacterium]